MLLTPMLVFILRENKNLFLCKCHLRFSLVILIPILCVSQLAPFLVCFQELFIYSVYLLQ